MSRHLFQCDGKAAIVDIPTNYRSDDWGAAIDRFAAACGKRDPEDAIVHCSTLYEDQKLFGIYYSWGLAGPSGAWFVIHQFPEDSPLNVEQCRNKLRRDQDVVTMHVRKVKEWVAFDLPDPVTMG